MSTALLFWVLVFLTLYPYLLYPVFLLLISRCYQRPEAHYNNTELPSVAVVISAFNEEKHIVERINNLLQQSYPAHLLTIYIGSDGSSDNTAALVAGFEDERVRLFDFAKNRGKISVLNELMTQVQEPVVVFSDANTHYQNDAIAKLIRHFENPEIGGVCGELHLVDKSTGSNQDGLYWRLEQVLKFHEGNINAYLGANGAIYAIRTALYKVLPEDTITDDFTIFMNLALAGQHIIYDREAIAEEEVAPEVSDEYGRRVRIGIGNYQAFFRLFAVFQWQQKWRLFSYISHKVIRWFTPHMMLLMLVLNLLLLDQPLYQLFFIAQLVLYIGAYVLVHVCPGINLPALLRLLVFFVSMNFALGHGFLRFVSGDYRGTWQRTER